MSNLRADLYTVIDGIVKNIYRKYYNSNPIIDKELKNMETTRTQFAVHLVAEGKAEGKAEVLQIIKLFLQGKAPNDISKLMNLALENVVNVLQEAGLIEQPQ